MPDNQPVPIKDVLADPTHPGHAAAKDMLAKLEKGEISLCACLGPAYGEPYCSCEMRRRGLPPSAEHEKAMAKSNQGLSELVKKFARKPQ